MLLDGTDLTIIGTGETVYHTRQAALKLREYGISARVLDMSSIKPCDEEAVLKAAFETGRIITVEEHSQYGGLGAMVTEIISEHPVPVKSWVSLMRMWCMGTPWKFLPIMDSTHPVS